MPIYSFCEIAGYTGEELVRPKPININKGHPDNAQGRRMLICAGNKLKSNTTWARSSENRLLKMGAL